MKFVRFGNIKKIKQKHYGKRDSFHSPPAREGFYAMPHKAQEFFLIGSISLTQPHLFPKISYYEQVYEKWKHIIDDIPVMAEDSAFPKEYLKECEDANQKFKKRLRDIRSQFTLTKDQEIWHHLGDHMKNNDVIKREGSWVLSRVKEYNLAFNRVRSIDRYKMNLNGMKHGWSASFTKDHFEVFIPFNI